MKILMVASFGGHFVQLKRLYQQIKKTSDCSGVEFMFGVSEPNVTINSCIVYEITNIHRESGIKKLLKVAREVFGVIKKSRPDVVISTGALPGLLFCVIGKVLGKKVIWVDSMANYQTLSFSGKIAKLFCDVCLTQWEHLAEQDKRLSFWGKVL
ncbi:UDP-N-acetylglucosamine transferase subunit ALG14 [Halomonas sp. KG2]|uniref:oligosaccharide biosynthesis protein Alg14 n=1 Tax=Halomonas sp. KG2 TaxID=2951138 RepID=UPI0026499E9B|nr:oligosaccharide biosynthesis protein Alg14 [Halomonas sp. KG2]WKD27080.1 UDP-N-acetylglucosamine transferase subunit ALG14 [Halomonas sp. KG2]